MKLTHTTILILFFSIVKSVAQSDTSAIESSPANQEPKKEILEYGSYSNETPNSASGIFSIDVDQDFFLDWWPGINEDRNYTQGTAFSFSKYALEESPIFYPMNLLEKIVSRKFDEKKIVKFPSTISMGVTAFTPRILEDSLNPVIGDRPFANVIFLTTTKNKYNNITKLFTSTSFSYGIIGSNIGNTFQSNAHIVIPPRPTNIGWQYQISRGGHPAFLFSHSALRSVIKFDFGNKQDNVLKELATSIFEGESLGDNPFNNNKLIQLAYRYKIIRNAMSSNDLNTIESAVIAANEELDLNNKEENKKSWFQLSLGYKLNLGWYTGLATVASFRIGKFSKFSNIIGMSNALSVANRAPDNNRVTVDGITTINLPGFLPKWSFEWYFFGSASPRITPYNSLLLGQPGVRSVYTLPKENYNPFVLDFEGGLVLSWLKTVTDVHIPLKNIDLVLSVNGRTSEIISKDPTQYNPYKRTHWWGRASLRFPLSLF